MYGINNIAALLRSGQVQQSEFYFRQPVTLTLNYIDTDVAQLDEARLLLYTWLDNDW